MTFHVFFVFCPLDRDPQDFEEGSIEWQILELLEDMDLAQLAVIAGIITPITKVVHHYHPSYN